MGLGTPFDGLADTPPMGWNSWNAFRCKINERLIKEMAEAMICSGMTKVGYEYIVIDDCWQRRRRKNGNLQVNSDKFPEGLSALAGYIHSLGLKLGIYTCVGRWTCQWYAGSYKRAEQDAKFFADSGIDFVKVDWCSSQRPFVLEDLDAPVAYNEWREAILKTGHPMILSICEWGKTKPWKWAYDVGHLWRTTADIRDNWQSFLSILDEEAELFPYAGRGHWNDPDMLEVGNGGMTEEEYKTHFSLWCMLCAPLMAGNDLRNMSESIRNILTAPEIIAVNQDKLGYQAHRINIIDGVEIWIKRLTAKEISPFWIREAVALFNRSETPRSILVNFADLGISSHFVEVRDLWARKEMGIFENHSDKHSGLVIDNIPPHATVMLSLTEKYHNL